ncbi:UNKNOWN [Stylonychia lemnae]|uniref:Uncharacterized protein n=1 Tax=Stylonychia lemnae TaxID=5949 RepID=A0A078AAA6_STYLE|nr:UNKNOWN [Stylonychia lemnae]|eukprot:CDW78811.1 UNKNOWN [Stylonychia lemnae]
MYQKPKLILLTGDNNKIKLQTLTILLAKKIATQQSLANRVFNFQGGSINLKLQNIIVSEIYCSGPGGLITLGQDLKKTNISISASKFDNLQAETGKLRLKLVAISKC